ncbi:TonB-dependent receptor [Pontibacter sp. E15-1]|uniref:SusC/RagA family TonB-linked outer membrane protein n=1 Tax=Pontibacter sp. E15-1 TaxID=2919918 RepID=UPI001F4FC61C|nr:TonB-dependent receptor [Pontibacter sp. E15-1]MCJ8164402.1 TonB-dependent receptor [Pontibacter sp. E15-1]
MMRPFRKFQLLAPIVLCAGLQVPAQALPALSPPLAGRANTIISQPMANMVLELEARYTANPAGSAVAITVSGKVTGEEGTGLPGVSVALKGTTTGTITDVGGNYILNVPDGQENGTLVFSYIGYLAQEVQISNRSAVDVRLQIDAKTLDEVVVVGYGTQKKSDITGSVAVIDAAEIKKTSTSDMSQLLQGRAPGVAVTSDGQPGAVPNVRIRGVSTFGNGQPLYVVDGVPLGDNASPRDFNPNDVESVQVLKDASSAAIYGSRAANGVVIITTKQGRKNTPLKIEYNGYYGVDEVWQRIPVTNRAEYQMLQNETQLNGGQTVAPANDPNSPSFISNIDTDWQEEGLKLGNRQNHNIVLSGGGEYNTYNISLDYFDNEGTFVGNGPSYERYSGRINTTAEKGRFSTGLSIYYTHSFENSLTYRGDLLLGGRPPLVGDLITAIPTMPVYDPNRLGGFGGTSSAIERGIILNAIGANSLIENDVTVDRVFSTGWGQLDLGHGLKYKLNLNYDRTMIKDYAFVPAFDLGYFFTNDISRLNRGNRIITTSLIENTLNYDKTFGQHTVSLLAGQMYQEGSFSAIGGFSQDLSTPYFPVLDNGSNKTASGSETVNTLASYLGRINYSYDDRYLLTATMRRDGSSRFAPINRYGNFPSIALGWKLHNETFFTMPEFISELKLRGSYGELGNQNIGDYRYYATINPNILYNFNASPVTGGLQTSLVAEDIKWETQTTSNVGFDARFFGGKIDFTAEYYRSTTTDILVGVPIPASTGSVDLNPVVNAGSLRNSGVEFDLGYHKMEGAFTFDVSANVYTLKNRVLSLGGNEEPISGAGARTQVGREVGEHYGWDVQGIFQTQEEITNHAFQNANTAPGDLIFRDVNEDGIINADDRIYLGSGMPNIYYGLNFAAQYKNFDFTMFASGMGDYLINSRLYRDLVHTQGYQNYHEDALDRWTPTNTNTDIPRLVAEDPNNNMRDSNREGWLQSGTHLRINTLSVGYKLPANLVKGMTSARVYATAQNLYTFQAYEGYNPDFTSGTFNPGFDFGSFPKPRTIMLGVQLGF